jgi:hypothetical protein
MIIDLFLNYDKSTFKIFDIVLRMIKRIAKFKKEL